MKRPRCSGDTKHRRELFLRAQSLIRWARPEGWHVSRDKLLELMETLNPFIVGEPPHQPTVQRVLDSMARLSSAMESIEIAEARVAALLALNDFMRELDEYETGIHLCSYGGRDIPNV